jgi:hypothetical protein
MRATYVVLLLYSRGPHSGPGSELAPSAPLTGTSQLHRTATYM